MMKSISNIGTKGGDNDTGNNKVDFSEKSKMFTLEEEITKYFILIQNNCNSNLRDKYRINSIDALVSRQTEMKVTYIIIKKLDIPDEFLNKHRITDINVFENLKSLSKKGKLNYNTLKPCGPILMIRITTESSFLDLKKTACSIWNLSDVAYSLYDDSFNNLECNNSSFMTEFFSTYDTVDRTLDRGQVCFYLIEKLNTQRDLLGSQSRCKVL